MKAFRDLSWPHLVPVDRLHTSPSSPALRYTDSASSLQPENIRVGGSHLRRSSEGNDRLSVPDWVFSSEAITGSKQSTIIPSDSAEGISKTPEDSGRGIDTVIDPFMTLLPAILATVSRPPSDSCFEVCSYDPESEKPSVINEVTPNTPREEFKIIPTLEPIGGVDTVDFAVFDILETEQECVNFVDPWWERGLETGEGFTRVDLDKIEHPFSCDFLGIDEKENQISDEPSLIPRIEIVKPSVVQEIQLATIDIPVVGTEVVSRSNSVSSSLSDQSRLSGRGTSISLTPSLDGPAPEMFSSGLNKVVGTTPVGAAIPIPTPGDKSAGLPTCCPDLGLPVADAELPLYALDSGSVPTGAIAQISGVTNLAGDLPTPPVPNLPGLPVDQTGQLPVPPLPTPNLTNSQKLKVKSKKAKVKAQKVIRMARRVVLRKSLLSVVLGRQLAGTAVFTLKLISRGADVPDVGDVAGRATGLVPAPIPTAAPI